MGKYEYQKKKVLSLVPDSLIEIFDEVEKSFFIAGGAITSVFTNKEVNDLDIYPKTKMAYLKLLSFMKDSSCILSCTEKSVFGVHSYGGIQYNLNVINLGIFENESHIFDKFDFSIVKGAFDMDSEEFSFDDNFFIDLASRRLSLSTSTLYPLMSIIRVDKYVKRGYNISLNEMTKGLLMVSKLNIQTIEDAEKHIGGLYGISLKELFKDKEFSLDALLELLSNPELNLVNKKPKRDIEMYKRLKAIYDNLLKEVCEELEAIPYFIHKNNVYKIKSTFEFEIADELQDDVYKYLLNNGRKLKPSDKDFIYVYKNVELRDGKLYSFYKKDYEYRIGEVCEADGHGNLYFYKHRHYNNGQFRNKENSVNLKSKVYLIDINSNGHETVKVKKCIPIGYKVNPK